MSLLQRVGWRRGALALAIAGHRTYAPNKIHDEEPEKPQLIGEALRCNPHRDSASQGPGRARAAVCRITK